MGHGREVEAEERPFPYGDLVGIKQGAMTYMIHWVGP